jgi:ribosome-associated toxin RatA of RatAB toxin-antitoxin module
MGMTGQIDDVPKDNPFKDMIGFWNFGYIYKH